MPSSPSSRHYRSLALLVAINLVCYMDRYILAAIIPSVKESFLAGDPNANGKAGLLTTAFLVTYMLLSPIFGWMADRVSRWLIIALSVGLWSLASGASGLAQSFTMLLITRVFLGVGEAGFAPTAPTLISDFYPVEKRGLPMAWFFMAIPVGSALGYAFGGGVQHFLGWQWAFFLVTPMGLLLAALCLFQRDPRSEMTSKPQRARLADYAGLLRIPSLLINIAGQTAMTFAIGGLSAWVPTYLHEARGQPLAQVDVIFGIVLASAGLASTMLGGWLADRVKKHIPGAYFLVSACGMLLGFPATLAMLRCPFPAAWILIFLAIFFLFLNTGPSNTALANVTPPAVRACAFGANILMCHLFGDAFSPALIGWIKDHGSWDLGFITVSTVMLVSGLIWLAGMKKLVRDTEKAKAWEVLPQAS